MSRQRKGCENFNPRSHEGSDTTWETEPMYYLSISIHAPTRGATRSEYELENRIPISIHAPTRGATHTEMCYSGGVGISIHAPTRGATPVRVYRG